MDRIEVIELAWNDDSTYRILSAVGHSSLLTQDLVWWSYSKRAIGYISANVDAVIGMVEEIFDIAKKNKLCGIKI